MPSKNLNSVNTVRTSPAHAFIATSKDVWREIVPKQEPKSTKPIVFTLKDVMRSPEIFVRLLTEWLLSMQAAKCLPTQAALACRKAFASTHTRIDADAVRKALAHKRECARRWDAMECFVLAALDAHPNLKSVRVSGCKMQHGFATLLDVLHAFDIVCAQSKVQARAKVEASTASANAGK